MVSVPPPLAFPLAVLELKKDYKINKQIKLGTLQQLIKTDSNFSHEECPTL